MEAVLDLEFLINDEKQGKSGGPSPVDVLFLTGVTPGPSKTFVPVLGPSYAGGGDVVQELSEGGFAELSILTGVQDELVPKVVHYPGWHPDGMAAVP
jgi:hypothetical protein